MNASPLQLLPHPLRAGAALLAGILLHMYWIRWNRLKKAAKEEQDKIWNNTVFFPTRPYVKTEHPSSSLSKFEGYLSKAEKSIKICVMTIQGRLAQRLLELLIAKHRVGVQIKVYSAASPGTRRAADELRDNGIQWRYKVHEYSTTMHHKYVIIDDRCIMTGSLNWTTDALENQKENVIIMNDQRIVPHYVKAFDRVWCEYDSQ